MFKKLTLLGATVFCVASFAQTPHGPVTFREHLIEPSLKGGYSVLVTDVNHDGKPDIIGLSSQVPELAWYENPGWQRHVLIKDVEGILRRHHQISCTS